MTSVEALSFLSRLNNPSIQILQALLAGKNVLAILPTGFGKRLIYQVFSMAQTYANVSVLVISPLNSIVEEQAKEMNGLGIRSVHLKPDIGDCLHDIFSLSPPRVAFLAWGDFHARSRFARSTIPEEKWGLLVV